jgi:hypothetical protein
MIQKLSLLTIILFITSCAGVKQAHQVMGYKITLANSNQKDTTQTKVRRKGKLISAFYGLDDALPPPANRVVCKGANYRDGMPVIFSHEIDVKTMQAGDFKVITASGKTHNIHCVTLAPADDPGELRTALLVGHYGSIEDQPVKVKIVGNILSIDGKRNFKGRSIKVTPLEPGPTMVYAEIVPSKNQKLGQKASDIPWGGGSGCPKNTKQVINVTWAGGITKPGGDPADYHEGKLYEVTVKRKGKRIKVTPFALADLNDGDNNHKLCLNVKGRPISVYFPAGFVTDPREDLNPATRINISN